MPRNPKPPSQKQLELAERLVLLRMRVGLNQSQAAAKANVRRAAIKEWETALAEPRLLQSVELAQAYNVSLDILAGVAPLPPPESRPRAKE